MIYGIGIDIVEINKIKKIVIHNGIRLAKRILSQSEFDIYMHQKCLMQSVRFLAKRFAVKEAVVKAFGTGFSQHIAFNQLEIFHDHLGKPILRLISYAALLFENLSLKSIHITLSDTNMYACAIAVCEC